jgi:uncharacterized lipoprotein YddW (UPF0748 family)
MTFTRSGPVLALLFLVSVNAGSQAPLSISPPKTEVRAVWITTASGLDWPHTTNLIEQQTSLRALLRGVKAARFNTVFFQVRARGDAYYCSRYEPWAENLTGTLGKDPGWDPLAFVLAEAHALGIEVHAWFNAFKIRGPNPVGPSTPEHPSRSLAAFTLEQDGELWLDPGRPEVRTYLVTVALDLIRRYDIDAINFDFIRYPGNTFGDGESYAKFGRSMNIHEWRRQNITAFVREVYTQAVRLKPMLKVGSSPFGIYREEANGSQRGSFFWVYQDSYGWLRDGIHDYLSPQVYWPIRPPSGEPDFARVMMQWKELAAGHQIYAGIAAYRPEIQRDLGTYIDTARAAGAAGQVFFRWENIAGTTSINGRYPAIALIPPMPWKDSLPPGTPTDLNVNETPAGALRLTWSPPVPARDGDTARYYAIYRWPSYEIPFEDPAAIVDVTAPAVREFVDTTGSPKGARYYYAVTALDRADNESAPSTIVYSHPPVLPPRVHTQAKQTTLTILLSRTSGRPYQAQYTLAQSTHVNLDLLSRRPDAAEVLHTTLVRGMQDEGSYSVELRKVHIPPGAYVFRLTTDRTTVEQLLEVK